MVTVSACPTCSEPVTFGGGKIIENTGGLPADPTPLDAFVGLKKPVAQRMQRHHTAPHHTHTTPHSTAHTTPHHTTPHHITPQRITPPHHTTACISIRTRNVVSITHHDAILDITPHTPPITLYYITQMSRHVTSRHVTSHHVTSRHVTSRHVTASAVRRCRTAAFPPVVPVPLHLRLPTTQVTSPGFEAFIVSKQQREEQREESKAESRAESREKRKREQSHVVPTGEYIGARALPCDFCTAQTQ